MANRSGGRNLRPITSTLGVWALVVVTLLILVLLWIMLWPVGLV
jgi:hypothetical protein